MNSLENRYNTIRIQIDLIKNIKTNLPLHFRKKKIILI